MGFTYGFEKMYQLASLCSSGTSYHKDIDMIKNNNFSISCENLSGFFADLSLSHY